MYKYMHHTPFTASLNTALRAVRPLDTHNTSKPCKLTKYSSQQSCRHDPNRSTQKVLRQIQSNPKSKVTKPKAEIAETCKQKMRQQSIFEPHA